MSRHDANGRARPRSAAAAALAVLLASAVGCAEASRAESPAPDPAVRPPYESAVSIPDSPVAGKLRGVDFTALEARYLVDTRPGYEHVDVKILSAGSDAPCGPPAAAGAPMVWLRRAGPGAITPHTGPLGAAGGERWAVHYQVMEGGRWLGSGAAVALLEIHPLLEDGTLRGDLAVCWDDGRDSCVAGRFSARACPIRIDAPVRGVEVMEVPPPRPASAPVPPAPPVPPGSEESPR